MLAELRGTGEEVVFVGAGAGAEAEGLLPVVDSGVVRGLGGAVVLVLLRAAAEGVTVVRLAARLLVGRLDAAVGEAVTVAVDVVVPAIVVRRGGVVFVVTEGRGGLRVVADRAARVDEDVLERDADGLTAVAAVVLPALPLLLAVLGVVEEEEEAEVLVRAAAAGRVDVVVVVFRGSVEDVGGGFLAAFIEASPVRNRVAGGIQ